MPKINIFCDERYPDYGISTEIAHYEPSVVISDEKLAEFKNIDKLYNAMQDELDKLYKEQRE